jgi:hypothetical protein
LRVAAAPRFMVILGASGAGKSSFLRAGLLPRLMRDDRHFLPLPVLRPNRAAITGDSGLLPALETALEKGAIATSRADIRAAIEGGARSLRPLLARLADEAGTVLGAADADAKPPTLVLPIDQGEELFLAEGTSEAGNLLQILRGLVEEDQPPLIVLVTIRSDTYDHLQTAPELAGIIQQTLSLPPMPRGAYQTVIEGPAARLRESDRPLIIEPALTAALLADIEAGGGLDALPLLAFTLERLYLEYGGRRKLTLADYDSLGRIKGSIETAVERALATADSNPKIPRDMAARHALMRRGLVPWLAGIDPVTKRPRRRVARLAEIPRESQALLELLLEQRLLSTDISSETHEVTIEPAHEALLRQWGLLQAWLAEDFTVLTALERIKQASRDWAENRKEGSWLAHSGRRLEEADQIELRQDLAAQLEPIDRAYLAACRAAFVRARIWRRSLAVVGLSGAVVVVGVLALLVFVMSRDLEDRRWAEHVSGNAIGEWMSLLAQNTSSMRYEDLRKFASETSNQYRPRGDLIDDGPGFWQSIWDVLKRGNRTALAQSEIYKRLMQTGDEMRKWNSEGDLIRALIFYQQAREIIAPLRKADPGNDEWKDALSMVEDKIGDVRALLRMGGHM